MKGVASIRSKCNSITLPTRSKRPTVGSHCVTNNIDEASWIVIGVCDDRGVKNNLGRIGAKQGPEAFRKMFYTQSLGHTSPKEKSIYDVGNLKLTKNILTTHEKLREIVDQIKSQDEKKKILVIGGGHDIAYGEIAGCIKRDQKIIRNHIINIDAHSDVRPYEKNKTITSGTPFYRLITEAGIRGEHYHPFGLQKPSNNNALVAWMLEHKVDIHWLEDMPSNEAQMKKFHELLQQMKFRKWHLNIDLDAFDVAHAPGVSAQAIFGVSPNLFLNLANYKSIFESIETLGIYELAPKYDIDGRTAKLAAKLAYQVMSIC
ncbi:MAG: formimidoylglutamase [Bdellovibrionales bacterium]|nr:formimidoylglutamase [Bdellovibrionales bacterium]